MLTTWLFLPTQHLLLTLKSYLWDASLPKTILILVLLLWHNVSVVRLYYVGLKVVVLGYTVIIHHSKQLNYSEYTYRQCYLCGLVRFTTVVPNVSRFLWLKWGFGFRTSDRWHTLNYSIEGYLLIQALWPLYLIHSIVAKSSLCVCPSQYHSHSLLLQHMLCMCSPLIFNF